LNAIFHGDMPYEIDWSSFIDDAKAANNLEFNGAHQVNAAFRILCKKDIDREAIKKIIRKIRFQNVKNPEDKKISIHSGTLEIACAFSLIHAGRIADRDIRAFMGKRLNEGPDEEENSTETILDTKEVSIETEDAGESGYEVNEIRQALMAFLSAIKEVDWDRYLSTIKPFEEKDAFGPAFARFTFEGAALAAETMKLYNKNLLDVLFIHMVSRHDPENAESAKVESQGEVATAEMDDGCIYRLVLESGNWVVDWPGPKPEDSDVPDDYEKEADNIMALADVFASARQKAGREGMTLDNLKKEVEEGLITTAPSL